MPSLSPDDYAALKMAYERLEKKSFALTLSQQIGRSVEQMLHLLPARVQDRIDLAVKKSLEISLHAATSLWKTPAAEPAWNRRMHTVATAVTGAAGGFFGVWGVTVELPVTTTIMLHSIADIARGNGEDLSRPENRLACLEVLALGPGRRSSTPAESAYYLGRQALARATGEAAAYIAENGVAEGSAPAFVALVNRIAARFGLEVSEKLAAELVPIIGAAGGATLNVLFMTHFQNVAEGHFTIRRLERKYGAETVRQEYVRCGGENN